MLMFSFKAAPFGISSGEGKGGGGDEYSSIWPFLMEGRSLFRHQLIGNYYGLILPVMDN